VAKLTYKEAGVDIRRGQNFVGVIRKLAEDLPFSSSIGKFCSLYNLGNFGCEDVSLATSADGVGTKLKIACMMGRHNTVGIDLVAMNVNDIITSGAQPVLFSDYISFSRLDDCILEDIMKGIVNGLRDANCSLSGGETAEMPDMYRDGEYDLGGFCIGIARKAEIIREDAEEGDVVVGLFSSGLHSNGYSLIRKIVFEKMKMRVDTYIEDLTFTIGEELLKPTMIYVKPILKAKKNGIKIKCIAHITGGGFYGNIPRILPSNVDMVVKKNDIPTPPIFHLIKEWGSMEEKEMFNVFNMGIGMVVVVRKEDTDKTMDLWRKMNYGCKIIGYIEKGSGNVRIV